MTDTPRTDDCQIKNSQYWAANRQQRIGDVDGNPIYDPWALCRQLEREVAALRAMLDAEPTTKLLLSAWERMDRARSILTDGNPRYSCNWGMLDTSLDKAMRDAQRIAAPNQLNAALCGWKDALMSAAGTNAATKQEAK